jgi:hypothetical protein
MKKPACYLSRVMDAGISVIEASSTREKRTNLFGIYSLSLLFIHTPPSDDLWSAGLALVIIECIAGVTTLYPEHGLIVANWTSSQSNRRAALAKDRQNAIEMATWSPTTTTRIRRTETIT